LRRAALVEFEVAHVQNKRAQQTNRRLIEREIDDDGYSRGVVAAAAIIVVYAHALVGGVDFDQRHFVVVVGCVEVIDAEMALLGALEDAVLDAEEKLALAIAEELKGERGNVEALVRVTHTTLTLTLTLTFQWAFTYGRAVAD